MLTVITPATCFDLTTLSRLKLALDIENKKSDKRLQMFISQASAICADFCRRVFASETVEETFTVGGGGKRTIVLARYPVTAITSITENDVALTAADYELQADAGLIARLHNRERRSWGRRVVVRYTGGYELPDNVPDSVERACQTLIAAVWFSAARDPAIRSESVADIATMSYLQPDAVNPAIPPPVAGLLNPWRDHRVF